MSKILFNPPTKSPQAGSSCLGVVLTGGMSSRMGKDKASLTLRGEKMLTVSQKLLHNIGIKDVVISSKFTTEITKPNEVQDIFEQAGPLGGIFSVIQKKQPKAMLILPVDLPLMTSDTLTQLKRVGELSQQACFFHQHYLPLYLPVNAIVEQFLSSQLGNNTKSPSIRAMLNQVPHKAITPKNEQTLFNTNTPQQWQQAINAVKQI